MYGDPLLNPDLNPYPDGLLQRLSAVGVNRVWLHTVLRDMAQGWRDGIAQLWLAVHKTPRDQRQEAQADLRLAEAAAIQFQSVANQTRFVIARDALATPSDGQSPGQRGRFRDEIQRRLESEIALARRLFTLTREDSRIGFEPSCQYFCLPLDLVEKVVNRRWLSGHPAAR